MQRSDALESSPEALTHYLHLRDIRHGTDANELFQSHE